MSGNNSDRSLFSRNVSRRTALASSTAALAGLLSVPLAAGSDGAVRVALTENEDGPVKTREIPYDVYRHDERTKQIADQFRHDFASDTVVASGVTPGNATQSGEKLLVPHVEVKSAEKLRRIPDHVDGIPVKKNVAKEMELLCHNDGDFDPVPGGVSCQADNIEESKGTFSAEVYRNEDGGQVHYMLTAAHVIDSKFNAGCEADGVGVFQSGQWIGWVEDSNISWDYAIVGLASDSDVGGFKDGIQVPDAGQFAGDQPGHYGLWTWHTEKGLEDLAKNDRYTHHVGRSVGYSRGRIKDTHYGFNRGCTSLTDADGNGVGVRTSNLAAGGDSGGPNYSIEQDHPDYRNMIGHTVGGLDEAENDICGATAYADTVCMGHYKIADVDQVYYWLST